jgi:glycosyltransferase involved in cell wall biosynthesis
MGCGQSGGFFSQDSSGRASGNRLGGPASCVGGIRYLSEDREVERATLKTNRQLESTSAYESRVTETAKPSNEKGRALSRRACKKILFVTNTSEYGGAERHLLDLIGRLREPGVKLCIVCLDRDFFTERLHADHDVEVITYKRTPRSLWDWFRLFRGVRPDVVVLVHSWFWTIPYDAHVGAWLAGVRKRFSIQHLMTPRPPIPAQLLAAIKHRRSMRGRLRRLLGRSGPSWVEEMPLYMRASMRSPRQIRRSASFCNTTICVSNALRDSLVNDFGFPVRKLRTIHNGISVSAFAPSESRGCEVREKLGLGRDEFVLVCVARLSEQKGIDILLQAMARVLRKGVRCKCIIVGDGPLRKQLVEQAWTMGLSAHVFFEGFHEDVRPYLQAGSAFILTSHREGLPLSILEAMACGLPTIVTNVGGNTEAITHRIHGLVVPPGSVDAVADAIAYLATHPEERWRMSSLARARVCEAFDIETRMADIERLILS